MKNTNFLFLTDRLRFAHFTADTETNYRILQSLSTLEQYVYGVLSQFQRIENIPRDPTVMMKDRGIGVQQRLDIYYYTLCWDKLRKVFGDYKRDMDHVLKDSSDDMTSFKIEFKNVKSLFKSLFSEFKKSVRNQYEHPDLEPRRTGGILEWGTLYVDGKHQMRLHVGANEEAIINGTHIDRLKNAWIALIDALVVHYRKQPKLQTLIDYKNYIERNSDHIIKQYKQLRSEQKHDDANAILGQFFHLKDCLSSEGIPIDDETTEKWFSNIQ